jgi:hypothetical protein
LADGNSRQLCLHLNSEPAVQEMPCFTGYVGSRSGVLDSLLRRLAAQMELPRYASVITPIIDSPALRSPFRSARGYSIRSNCSRDRGKSGWVRYAVC